MNKGDKLHRDSPPLQSQLINTQVWSEHYRCAFCYHKNAKFIFPCTMEAKSTSLFGSPSTERSENILPAAEVEREREREEF